MKQWLKTRWTSPQLLGMVRELERLRKKNKELEKELDRRDRMISYRNNRIGELQWKVKSLLSNPRVGLTRPKGHKSISGVRPADFVKTEEANK